MDPIGTPLGILIGLISGAVFDVLLGWFLNTRTFGTRQLAVLSGHALGLPGFCLGGPWLTATLVQGVHFDALLPQYLLALVGTFFVIVAYPLLGVIVSAGAASGGRSRSGARRTTARAR